MCALTEFERIINQPIESIWSTCKEIVAFINEKPDNEQEEIFTSFLKDVDLRDLDVANGELDELLEHDSVRKTTDIILDNLVKKRIDEDSFYTRLWDKYCDEDLFPAEDDKVAFLGFLWLDARIPYYKVSVGCSMEEEEFQVRVNQIKRQLRKAEFVIWLNNEQKTERVSILYEISQEIMDEKDKIVFGACVIDRLAKREALALLRRGASESKQLCDEEKSEIDVSDSESENM